MIRLLQVVSFACALVLPHMAAAQSAATRPLTLGLSGGLSIPSGDFADGLESGFNVTAHVNFRPAMWTSARFRGDVSFDRWDVEASDITTRSIGVTGNIVYDFPVPSTAMIRPYVLGGAGVFNGKASAPLAESTTDVGVQAGGGLSFLLAGFSTFAELKLVNVFSEGTSTRWIPLTFGVRF